MNQRNRLMELLDNAFVKCDDNFGMPNSSQVVKYLLDNGVMVPPCKVGDTVYLLRTTDWGDILSYEVIEVGIDQDGLFFVYRLTKLVKRSFLLVMKRKR